MAAPMQSTALSRGDLLGFITTANGFATFQNMPMHQVLSWLDGCLDSLMLNGTVEASIKFDGSPRLYRISPINFHTGSLKRQH